MKNTNEVQAILTAIFAINKTSDAKTRISPESSTMHFEDFSNRTQIYSYSPA